MSQKQRKGAKPKAAPIKEEPQDSNEFRIDCKEFKSIQTDLNLDDEAAEDAYKTFKNMSIEYTLSDPITDWYACAIYTSCRKANTKNSSNGQTSSNGLPEANTSSSQSEGNFVSLTRILRSCKISVIRFCKKMALWSDMVNFSDDMKNKLNQLESSFNVTTAIYKKYKTIFEEIFKCPSSVVPSRFCGKNRKNMKKQALTSNDIYHFCWTLFVFIKSNFSRIKGDLMNSYHLLLVCIDYCFGAVLTFDNALDIINTSFYESLAKSYGKDPKQYQMDSHSPSKICIIDLLCEKFGGRSVEVKEIKKHWVRKLIKDKIESKRIKKKENGNGIIDTDVIDANFRYLKQVYEQFVLSGGDFDECVFLNDNASRELGTDELQSAEINEAFQNLAQRSNHDNPNNLIPMTPLTSKQYMSNGIQNSSISMTPISSATQSVSRLQTILLGQQPKASERLEMWLKKFTFNGDLLENINSLLKRMGDIFVERYNKDDETQEIVIRCTEAFRYVLTGQIEKRRDSAVAFFFNILEKMFFREVDKYKRKNIPENEFLPILQKLFERNHFIQALFICSLEVIIFTYKLRNFSYVWEIFNDEPDLKMHPFYVYKVIEPIIREEPNLPRDLVNRLSEIEEKIQDSLAWNSESPIWTWLASMKGKAPTCQEVSFNVSVNNYTPSTPIKAELGTVLLTPKKLVPNSVLLPPNPTIQALQARSMDPPPTPNVGNSNSNPKPALNALGLFFRKIYLLASIRLMFICDRLKIKSEELRKLMWTCLENAISQHTELLADRHLDQLIMCAVYSVNTINKSTTGSDIKFQDIINAYIKQPQAKKHIYRNVLLTSRNLIENNNQITDSSSAGADKRGNIIEFYNKIFLEKVSNDYILQLNLKKSSPPMSPIPNRMHAPLIQSPLRQFPNSQIFISPLRKIDRLNSPINVMSFPIQNGSNSHNLSEINRMINSHRDNEAANTMLMINTIQNAALKRATKRIFQDEDKDGESSTQSKVCCLTRRIQTIFNERQILSASSSANASGTEDSNDSASILNPSTSQANTSTATEATSSLQPPPPPILSSPPIVTVNNA